MDAKTYWDKYYQEHPFRRGKGPSDFLVRMLPRLQKGRALDVAMGEGANAVYLAQKGFQVKGFDISQVATERAAQLARETGVELEVQQADLDLYIFGLMTYETIVMSFYRPIVPRYYSEMVRALKQGGTLLVESHMTAEMDQAIGKDESFRNFYFAPNELLRAVSGLRVLYYHEGLDDGHHVVQLLASKPIDRDAAKFKLFDMQTGQAGSGSSKQLELAERLFKK